MLSLRARPPFLLFASSFSSSTFTSSPRLKLAMVPKCSFSSNTPPEPTGCGCRCGRRHLLLGGASAGTSLRFCSSSKAGLPELDGSNAVEKVHPARPDWYEKLYAKIMSQCMKSYEKQVAGYKEQIFSNLTDATNKVLEFGVGTGTNFKYYASRDGLQVVGVDPNKHMEEYARAAAVAAGLPSTNFTFKRGVGEVLPAEDNSVDAVIGTLVLCSVKDVDLVLREVKRVLKPGGQYIFIEHVAAKDGSFLQFVQGILDPLQQFISDGCHLRRKTGKHIEDVGFSSLSLNSVNLRAAFLLAPHVYGVASK